MPANSDCLAHGQRRRVCPRCSLLCTGRWLRMKIADQFEHEPVAITGDRTLANSPFVLLFYARKVWACTFSSVWHFIASFVSFRVSFWTKSYVAFFLFLSILTVLHPREERDILVTRDVTSIQEIFFFVNFNSRLTWKTQVICKLPQCELLGSQNRIFVRSFITQVHD